MKKEKDLFPILIILFTLAAVATSDCIKLLFPYRPVNQEMAEQNQYHNYTKEQEGKEGTPQKNFEETKSDQSEQYQASFNKAYAENNYSNTIYWGEQLMAYEPDNISNLLIMAYCYLELKNYQKSMDFYNKVLSLDPNNANAVKGLNYINNMVQYARQNNGINNMKTGQKAPMEIYSIIKTNLPDEVKTKTEAILDLIWQSTEGQIVLKTLWQNNIPIHISQNAYEAKTSIISTNGQSKVEEIIIPMHYISSLSEVNLSQTEKMYYLENFLHEITRAFSITKTPQNKNSMEEELSITLIGYSISYKIVTGSYLNKEQVQYLSLYSLEKILNSDKNKNLPVYSGFSQKIQNSGITLPYPEMYEDIPFLYQHLIKEGKVQSIEKLDKLVKQNSEAKS